MSAPREKWGKSAFQQRKKTFESKKDGVAAESGGEDETLSATTRRRAGDSERYRARTNEPRSHSGSRVLTSPPGIRVAGGGGRSLGAGQRRSTGNDPLPPQQQRGSMTGEFSEEGAIESGSLSRTHTLAIGEETGQKERVIVHAAETVTPSFSSQSQSDDSEREDLAMAAQISTLSKQNQHLEAQLRDMEQERERLREMLAGDKTIASPGATGSAPDSPYLPPGLPSKVLDGRKVMKPGDKGGIRSDNKTVREEDLMKQIDSLRKSRREIEQRLREVSEEKRRLETELKRQREALTKMQDREQDLSKDIETLRDENSHHSSTISKLQLEHGQLHTESASLHSELTSVSEKLAKIQRCYRQAEQENMHLAEELREMERDRVKLYEEKMKLQLSVDDGQKTKENYRLTIRKLREENTALKSQKTDPGNDKSSTAVVEPEKTRSVSQAVDEMMQLREERMKLQEELQSAQRDIDSLRTQIEGHSLEQEATNIVKRNVGGHLKDLCTQVSSVFDDLETTRATVTTLTEQQNQITRKQFQDLAKRCGEEIAQVVSEKKSLAKALDTAKRSLAKLQIELQVIRAKNAKLQSHKTVVADDVSQLRSEVSRLQDQKKMLERQLSQNETLTAEQEKTIRELETGKKKLKSQLQSSEKNWKNQLARHERDWEDRMAEMDAVQGNLTEEKEDLLCEKTLLEGKLASIELANRDLEEEKDNLEDKVDQLEVKIVEMESRLADNTEEILRVRSGIAKAVVKQACISALAHVETEHEKDEFTAKEKNLKTKMAALTQERDKLTDSLKKSEQERKEIEARSKNALESEEKIKQLTTQLDSLKTENETIRAEIKSLSELRQSAVDNLEQLSEAKQSLQLDNQKIHMTLRTEISLLQTKLKTVEDEKHALEARVSDLVTATGAAGTGEGVSGVRGMITVTNSPSTFEGATSGGESGYPDTLRRVIHADTQQMRRENTEIREKKVPSADLHSRMMMLEAENRRLKDTLRSGKEPPDSNPALRKKIIKLSQRNFFLEWEKKDLSDKLQIALRLSRETKATEKETQLREMNQSLSEKVRGLEESLLKRRSAIDIRITETVKENGRLHQQLIALKNGFDESCRQRGMMEELIKWTADEGPRVVKDLQTSLMTFKLELQELESLQGRMRTLQDELPHIMMSSEVLSGRSLIRTSSASLPPVLKGLNPTYLSRLGGTATSPPPSTPTTPILSPSSSKLPSSPQSPTALSDVKEKFQHFSQLADETDVTLKKTFDLISNGEEQVVLVCNQFAEHEQKLTEVMGINKKLQDQFDKIDEQDLHPDQLQTIGVLQKQIESLEDQVIDRDVALQEIESQMKQDYEQHDQLIRKRNREVLDLRDQLSAQMGKLRSKDVYLQQADSRYLELETKLMSLRKENEKLAHEREELISQALPEHLNMVAVATGGTVSLGDVIRIQGDEIRALQKTLVEYTYQLIQLHQQLTTADRQRTNMQAKILSSERMQQQMNEHSTAEINYLRQLNLQFVEQQAKGDKGKVLLEEVRKVKEALRQQQEGTDTQRELNGANIKLLEQERKIQDLEFQLHTQQVSLTMLKAEKQHALSSLSQDLTNQITTHPSSGYLMPRRPMSAGSEGGGGPCRRPNYHFLNRGQPSSRNSLMQTEFTIQIPGSKGGSLDGSEIVNLNEEHSGTHHNTLSLGPAVVTDDESSRFVDRHLARGHEEAKIDKLAKHQQIKKIRRHRRTASTGSNMIYIPQKDTGSTATLPSVSGGSKPVQQHVVNIVKPKPLTAKQQLNRPGSAGSNPAMGLHRVQSPERIKETAHEVMEGITKLINESESGAGDEIAGGGEGDKSTRMRRVKSGGVQRNAESGTSGDTREGDRGVGSAGVGEGQSEHQSLRTGLTSSLPIGLPGTKSRHKHEVARNKPSGKTSETTETPSAPHPQPIVTNTSSNKKMPGGLSRPSGSSWLRIFSGKEKSTTNTSNTSSSTSSGKGSGAVKTLAISGSVGETTKMPSSTVQPNPATSTSSVAGPNTTDQAITSGAPVTQPSMTTASHAGPSSKLPPSTLTDLSRTPSMISTSSTISTFPPSTLPSRNPSFAYDGGGESSPHSLESVEIGDSIENLLAFQTGRMNYSYFIPIRTTKDTTSSSDEDSVRGFRHSRRKRSSGTNTDATAHSTQQSKDEDDNSNSSNDSDQLHNSTGSGVGGGYHRGSQSDGAAKTSAPVCRQESISITAIEEYPTDVEVDEKAALLKKSFPRDRHGRLRTSSTGSIHICYSDSNTSMEDVSKNF